MVGKKSDASTHFWYQCSFWSIIFYHLHKKYYVFMKHKCPCMRHWQFPKTWSSSNSKVKVTRSNINVLIERSSYKEHVKLESPFTNHLRDMANVKVFEDKTNIDKQTDGQPRPKTILYMPLIFQYQGA
jgi:hypothetical protein